MAELLKTRARAPLSVATPSFVWSSFAEGERFNLRMPAEKGAAKGGARYYTLALKHNEAVDFAVWCATQITDGDDRFKITKPDALRRLADLVEGGAE